MSACRNKPPNQDISTNYDGTPTAVGGPLHATHTAHQMLAKLGQGWFLNRCRNGGLTAIDPVGNRYIMLPAYVVKLLFTADKSAPSIWMDMDGRIHRLGANGMELLRPQAE